MSLLRKKSEEDPFRFFSDKNSHFVKYNPTLIDEIKEYLQEVRFYMWERERKIYLFLSNLIITIPQKISDNKHLFVSKMFWGRGNVYKYLGVLGISLIVLTSIIFINLKNNYSSSNLKVASLASDVVGTSGTSGQAAGTGTISQSVHSSSLKLPQSSGVTGNGIVTKYVVQIGDTLASISKKYSINSDIIAWANKINSDSDLTPGKSLKIFPVQGIIYTVSSGDTLASIASKYSISQETIIDWNLLSSGTVTTGQKIMLAGAKVPQQAPQVNYATTNVSRNLRTAPVNTGTSGSSWFYSQFDPRWEYYILGGGYSRYSGSNIASIGCLVTDVAMVAKYYGYNISPLDIARNPSNFDGVLFNWNGLGYFNVTPLGGLWGGANWTSINKQLEAGHPVIVSIGWDYHYVTLIKRLSNGDYVMNDPARGADLDFNSYFSPSEITQAVMYTPL